MKRRTVSLIVWLLSCWLIAGAQDGTTPQPVRTLVLGSDQIGVINTSQNITTRISFDEPVKEIVCGDLYDPESGKGTFVFQKSGDQTNPGKDVYVKPVASKGSSNVFITIGGKEEAIFNFKLEVVPSQQAYYVVKVKLAQPVKKEIQNGEQPTESNEPHKSEVTEAARQEADNIRQKAQQDANQMVRTATQQAERIVQVAEAKALEVEQQATDKSRKLAEEKFINGLALGIQELKINRTRAEVQKVVITLDPRIYIFDEGAFLRYSISNNSGADFRFSGLALEINTGTETKTLDIKVRQNKSENSLQSAETITGVIMFEAKALTEKDKCTLLLRDEAGADLLRMNIR